MADMKVQNNEIAWKKQEQVDQKVVANKHQKRQRERQMRTPRKGR